MKQSDAQEAFVMDCQLFQLSSVGGCAVMRSFLGPVHGGMCFEFAGELLGG